MAGPRTMREGAGAIDPVTTSADRPAVAANRSVVGVARDAGVVVVDAVVAATARSA